ncbi:hypothetical protein RUND412_001352 [Rhizina undulata]
MNVPILRIEISAASSRIGYLEIPKQPRGKKSKRPYNAQQLGKCTLNQDITPIDEQISNFAKEIISVKSSDYHGAAIHAPAAGPCEYMAHQSNRNISPGKIDDQLTSNTTLLFTTDRPGGHRRNVARRSFASAKQSTLSTSMPINYRKTTTSASNIDARSANTLASGMQEDFWNFNFGTDCHEVNGDGSLNTENYNAVYGPVDTRFTLNSSNGDIA